MELTNITARLITTKGDGENARVINHIGLTVPSLAWKDIKLKPSDLRDCFRLFEENEAYKNSEDEEERDEMYTPSFRKFARSLDPYIKAFNTEAKALGWEGFSAIMATVAPILAELGTTESAADPLLDCKRRAAKADTYANLSKDGFDYHAAVYASIEKEISDLMTLKIKASGISNDTFAVFVTEKFNANGVDEAGYVKLRSKKPEVVTTPA